MSNQKTLSDKIAKALQVIAPNSEWSLSGNSYDDLIWLSKGEKPNWALVEAEINNPTPEPELTVEQKLGNAGLNLADLKSALGL